MRSPFGPRVRVTRPPPRYRRQHTTSLERVQSVCAERESRTRRLRACGRPQAAPRTAGHTPGERPAEAPREPVTGWEVEKYFSTSCLLYTSDAADDRLCVNLGGRRIIHKK